MLEGIKNWVFKKYYHIYLDYIQNGMVKYSYLEPYKKKSFIEYVKNVAIEIANNEGIKIFFLPFDEINKNETVEKEKAIGAFRYLRDVDDNNYIYEKLIDTYKKLNKDVPIKDIYPRIEISEKGDVFTILHELGHYFIYKADKIQSEEGANLFIGEFFDKHLPPFFKWIYQIEIECRTGKKVKYTTLECYNYLKQYNNFCKKYNDGN
jgi:hypothetical protein